jgi:hypothetical protein
MERKRPVCKALPVNSDMCKEFKVNGKCDCSCSNNLKKCYCSPCTYNENPNLCRDITHVVGCECGIQIRYTYKRNEFDE